MRFQIRDLLIVTTVLAVLLAATSVSPVLALIMTIFSFSAMAMMVVWMPIAFFAGAFHNRSLRGGLNSVFVGLCYWTLVTAVVGATSGFMLERGFGG